MRLKARLDRIEAAAAWLRYDGWALLCQRRVEVLEWQRRYDEALERQERAKEREKERATQQAAARARATASAACPDTESEPVSEVALVEEAGSTVDPPPPEPEPPPLAEAMDIPEEMQIRPTSWGWQTAYDDDGGHDYSRCLTEYDPLAECDDDSS